MQEVAELSRVYMMERKEENNRRSSTGEIIRTPSGAYNNLRNISVGSAGSACRFL